MQTKIHQTAKIIQLTHSAINFFRYCRIHFFPNPEQPNPKQTPPPPWDFPNGALRGRSWGKRPWRLLWSVPGIDGGEFLWDSFGDRKKTSPSQSLTWFTWKWHPGIEDSELGNHFCSGSMLNLGSVILIHMISYDHAGKSAIINISVQIVH